jgi:hypothetical protein
VTILPSVISVNDITQGSLIVSPIVDPALHAEFVVIQPTRRTLSTPARLFLERFEAEVAHIHRIWDEAIGETSHRTAGAYGGQGFPEKWHRFSTENATNQKG